MVETVRDGPSLQDLITDAVRDQRECFGSRGNDLLPKPAQVIDYDDRFGLYPNPRMPWENGLVTLSGEGFVAVDNGIGRRTVFLTEPTTNISGVKYYLEVKGYGRNGRELWPHKHSAGDLYFGTFIDSAEREFYIPKRLRELGITNIQIPVELLAYRESDFVGFTIPQLAELLSNRLCDLYLEQDRIIDAIRQLLPHERRLDCASLQSERIRKRLGRQVAEIVLETYQAGGKTALRQLAERVGLENELAGLIDERQAGYVIRAVKSPIRVGDLHDPEIVTERNKVIAQQIGKTVRQMLELGFLHMTPNPGNWTTEEELVDFEDVARLPQDAALIAQDMAYRHIPDMKSYLKFIFGEGTIGYLTADFQKGFMGRKTTTDGVVKTSLRILQTLGLR